MVKLESVGTKLSHITYRKKIFHIYTNLIILSYYIIIYIFYISLWWKIIFIKRTKVFKGLMLTKTKARKNFVDKQ